MTAATICKLLMLLAIIRGPQAKYAKPAYLPMHTIVETDIYPNGSTFRFIHNDKTVLKVWMNEKGKLKVENQ